MSRLQSGPGRRGISGRSLFYILLLVSIIVALFVSILAGLILLIATIAYYTWISRKKPASEVDHSTQPSDGSGGGGDGGDTQTPPPEDGGSSEVSSNDAHP